MPLRDDLLDPIAGETPCGPDLRYDPVFDQIKEARREEDDTLPSGDWNRPAKKADHRQVVKLAGECLARRTKDLSLAAHLVESQFKLEGLAVIAPCIELLRRLQERFWKTLYPAIDDDGDLQLRVNEIERAAKQVASILVELPLTANGLTAAKYRESRTVGYKADATTEEREKTRKAAIEAKKLTAEEFDKAVTSTPKAFYIERKEGLDEAINQTELLDRFQREAYGEQYPQLSPLKIALQEAYSLIDILLAERRKTDPDPATTFEKMAQWPTEPATAVLIDDARSVPPASVASYSMPATGPDGTLKLRVAPPPASLSRLEDAYSEIVSSAQFVFEADPQSPVPYLVCAALRLGETRRQGASPEPGFAIGPSSQTRQSLRALAIGGAWVDLLRAALPVMAEPCARAWLDLHRYIWRAAKESGASVLAAAVSGTIRELLTQRPEVRNWTLEDDTGAANPETQAWIESEVLRARGA